MVRLLFCPVPSTHRTGLRCRLVSVPRIERARSGKVSQLDSRRFKIFDTVSSDVGIVYGEFGHGPFPLQNLRLNGR